MTDDRWELWGPLAERYRTSGPRRILALDGGGIRGMITLGVLDRLERELRAARGAGDDFRLCHVFDLIGGTSTGAIIAAGLARGLSVGEIARFYREFGTEAFSRRKPWMLWRSLYEDGGLARMLKDRFGEHTTLRPDELGCLLVIVTRNATTDSAWPISSNPFAKYNDPTRPDCNLKIPLWRLVRASTAAPFYFAPEVLEWDPDDPAKSFVFVDGGTTPYNNPAFLLFRMATTPAYRLGWATGERELIVVSVGTGSAPVLGATANDPEGNVGSAALNTLHALMSQASVDQDVNCRTIGRCVHGGFIDREVEALLGAPPDGTDDDTGKAFRYVRYNAQLDEEGLDALGLAGAGIDPARVRKMTAVDRIDDLERIGQALGQQVSLDHLGGFA